MVTANPPATDTLVVHANWSGGRLHFWAESASAYAELREGAARPNAPDDAHPFALAPTGIDCAEPGRLRLTLPATDGLPLPSDTLGFAVGRFDTDAPPPALHTYKIPTVSVGPAAARHTLERLTESDTILAGDSARYYATGAHLAQHLLARQRFVPLLRQDETGALTGLWSPWLSDDHEAERVAALVQAMPPSARAQVDDLAHGAWAITSDYIASVVDAGCRSVLTDEEMTDTIEDLDPGDDHQVAWLTGMLDAADAVPTTQDDRTEVARRVRRWIGGLDERGESTSWRLGLRLNEPIADKLPDRLDQPGDNIRWSISFFLESLDEPDVTVGAADIWLMTRGSGIIEGLKLDSPQELLLGELARASRLYKHLESVLDDQEPIELMLTTKQAYQFLREDKPVLAEQGFSIVTPDWWDAPAGRLGAKLQIESDDLGPLDDPGGLSSAGSATIGLNALVGYHWQIAVGDTTLTLKEFEQFATKSSPLVRIGGKWVEIRPEDVKAAVGFIQKNPGGQMPLAEAMQLAFASDARTTGVPVLGMQATGWVGQLFGGEGPAIQVPMLDAPEGFIGTLRPYQLRGLSWMAFMERFGFGACLADDMGLGKTIQLLALLAHERAEAAKANEDIHIGPTLLVVPMSVVGNWAKEVKKFTPQLSIMVHHGIERLSGESFVEATTRSDIVITTYALANRDQELFREVEWHRIVLDEAQFIKNPAAKQSQAVRSLTIPRRIALTGTPVENRLSELWSIMDFLNPSYLGTPGQFRTRFGLPIERYRDQHRMDKLRGLVRPFILRRVKTDPTVIAELPDKIESKEYCSLMPEQAELYQSCVKQMLDNVDAASGIHRRGLVLAALIKLKQICNHPAQFLKDHEPRSPRPVSARRSGKCIRIIEMLNEVLAEDARALVFTQFRQMGHLLESMFAHEFGREVLFLHGGTPQGKRQQMIDRFQDPGSDIPILLLSLKAGGVGLNLTAATHVFHFDRWWNPAVENQATDRAYRIGQKKTVQVHKFVVQGTLEERIDEMIESKMELAENIIGHGERWLTELDTDHLRDLLALRADAIGEAGEIAE